MIALINSGPGTGKTFTLTYGYLTLSKQLVYPIKPTVEQKDVFDFICSEFPTSSRCCFFAHNLSVKETLEKRLPKSKVGIYTLHGAGMSAIISRYGFQKPINNRTERHIQAITGKDIYSMPYKDRFDWLSVKKLVHYFKIEDMEVTEENFLYLKHKYPDLAHLFYPDDWQERVNKLLRLSAIPDGFIDHADMLYLGAKAARPKYDLGFVDESQDVSKAAYNLVIRLCKNVVFCGDRNQAINAFAGASEEMYSYIEKKSDAVLPLKSTLRNPPNIVDLANSIRPGGVTYGPRTEPGRNETLPYESLPEKLREEGVTAGNTLILSRTNAAITSAALSLYQAGIPCCIIDKDLADELIKFIKSLKASNLAILSAKLDAYEEKAHKSRSALWTHLCCDKAQQVRSFLAESNNHASMLELIKQTFRKKKDGFKLTTIHKAKGLEAENIFILNPPIELSIAMKHPIGREQEINLAFVGVTRTANNLYWVK